MRSVKVGRMEKKIQLMHIKYQN